MINDAASHDSITSKGCFLALFGTWTRSGCADPLFWVFLCRDWCTRTLVHRLLKWAIIVGSWISQWGCLGQGGSRWGSKAGKNPPECWSCWELGGLAAGNLVLAVGQLCLPALCSTLEKTAPFSSFLTHTSAGISSKILSKQGSNFSLLYLYF